MLRWMLGILTCAGVVNGSTPAALKHIVIVGDSITEGYGVAHDQAYPALIQRRADKDHKNWKILNAGISGSTSASAVSRVKWHLKSKPDLIVLALGANDGLRGLAPLEIEKNLSAAVELCQGAKVKVILAGMHMPPNYGKDYRTHFDAVFVHVAAKYKIPRIPFLLENVAGHPDLNQSDGIHPNDKGHAIVADTVYRAIEKEL